MREIAMDSMQRTIVFLVTATVLLAAYTVGQSKPGKSKKQAAAPCPVAAATPVHPAVPGAKTMSTYRHHPATVMQGDIVISHDYEPGPNITADGQWVQMEWQPNGTYKPDEVLWYVYDLHHCVGDRGGNFFTLLKGNPVTRQFTSYGRYCVRLVMNSAASGQLSKEMYVDIMQPKDHVQLSDIHEEKPEPPADGKMN